MVDKSLLREKIDEVLEERDIHDESLADDIIDRLESEGEVYDDEDEEEEGDEDEDDEERF